MRPDESSPVARGELMRIIIKPNLLTAARTTHNSQLTTHHSPHDHPRARLLPRIPDNENIHSVVER
jgi:hypothetical protein